MSYYNAMIRAGERARTKARNAARDLKRNPFVLPEDLDPLADFDETEAVLLRERAHRMPERDLYNDERRDGIFGMSGANPNDYF